MTQFPRKPPRRISELGIEPDGYILFAGRLSPEKGVDTLLEALRPLPRTKKLVLAGASSYSNDYMEAVRASAWDEVQFLGQVDHETMHELYSNCYAFVLPSVMEGLSVALLEALSFGTCIVTTDIPENVEVVGDAGVLFESGDVMSLRAALASLIESPEKVRAHRQLATARANTLLDWDDVADRTEAFYLSLVGSHGRA